ncbi:MAG: methylenetetrahydrofolate reductase [NAD(P)H] [Gammaproteobacteria bacterium]|nr:methylenetetrahydrofolate reductase [NAD(P)H] [Gammaproteobacteria bacterium]
MTTTTDLSVSCEFFPPRTDAGRTNWREALNELAVIKPEYFSCTYGAGGTTQEGTRETLRDIIDSGFAGAAHITCIGSTRDKILSLLDTYKNMGVQRLVALRGDLPQGMSDPGEFHHANELVAFIRETTGDDFHIEVAAYPEKHPESLNFQDDFQNFVKKVDAGADSAITQFFFNVESYYRFLEDGLKAGIDIPVIPGIMPITNYKSLAGFASGCGAEIPRWLSTRLEGFADDLESIREFGFEVVLDFCEQLVAVGAPGLHFYTLNRAQPTIDLVRELGLINTK